MIEFITEVLKSGPPDTPEGRTDRFKQILPYCLTNRRGNILEIGAGNGMSTKVFLKSAADYNRKVLVIDPWETLPNQPPGYGDYSYQEFIENTADFVPFLTVCKKPSNGKCGSYLKDHAPFSFAFVDGLQLEGDVTHDLYLCSHYNAQVICVDDFNRTTKISQVPQAVKKFLADNKQYAFIHQNTIECYLIRLY